jgi:hypothetical protein
MKKSLFLFSFSLFLIMAIPLVVKADDPPPLGGDPGGTPIDGVSLLVAAGVGYGAKKLYNRKGKAGDQTPEDEKNGLQ